jgi:regulatory protein
MKITAIEPRSDGGVDVHIDGGRRLTLSAEVVFAEGLHSGDEITADGLARLERRFQAWRAHEAALLLLSYRARSKAELRRRLLRKGFDEEIADECLAGLGELGVVDDAAFAGSFVRDRVRLRPHGSRRLARELRAKGVDADVAEAAVQEVMEDEGASDVDLARAAAARWHARPGEERDRARRRLHDFLARRGFAPDAIRAVLEETLG